MAGTMTLSNHTFAGSDHASWPCAKDLAGLPGLPGTERGIRKRASLAGWNWVSEPVRGGWLVRYDPSTLPPDVRLQLASKAVAGTSAAAALETQAPLDHVQQRAKFIVKASGRTMGEAEKQRTRVLVLFQRWWQHVGGTLHPAIEQFAALWTAGHIEAPTELRQALPKISASSLRRWWLRMQEKGSLQRPDHPKRGKFKALTGEVGTATLAVLASKPHLSAAAVHRLLIDHGMVSADQIPSERAFARAIAAFKRDNAQAWLAHTDPDAWRSRYLAASGDAAAHITRPNEEWQMDSTVGDAMLFDPSTGEIRRHHIVAVIDVFTRRVMFLVTRTSRSNAIASLIRKAIDAWGRPERIKTDNGSDYTAEALEFSLLQLGIEHPLCEPFEPQQKPFVERVFGTLLHQLFPLLTGFIGHNVAQRKAIENARSFAERLMGKQAVGQHVELRLTPAQLQAMIDNWVHDYHHREHGSLGISPAAMTEQHLREIVRIDTRALDLFLRPVAADEIRTVSKKGICLDNGWFTAPELGGMEGRQVRVRMDEAEIGQLYAFDLDGQFICAAIDKTRLGNSAQEVAAKRKAHQKQVVDGFKDVLRHAKRAYDTDQAVRDIYLDREHAAIAKALGDNVRRLPPRETLGTTPAIDSALNGLANRGKAQQVPAHMRGAVDAVMARLEAAEGGAIEPTRKAEVFQAARTQNARYSTWLRMRSRTEQGQALTPAERSWFDAYATSAEWRSMERLHEGQDPLAVEGGGA